MTLTSSHPFRPGWGSCRAHSRRWPSSCAVDDSYIAAAAQCSEGDIPSKPGQKELAQFVGALPEAEKNRLLLGLAGSDTLSAQRDLLHQYRQSQPKPLPPTGERRTVAELVEAAAVIRAEGELARAQRSERASARRARDKAAAREKYLNEIAGREPELWQEVERFIDAKPPRYEDAVERLGDLQDLAARLDEQAEFSARLAQLRSRHNKKRKLMTQLDRMGLAPTMITFDSKQA